MLGSSKIQTKLEWEGKQTEVERVKLPFQLVEVVNEPRAKTMDMFMPRLGSDKWYNMLIWGDNKLVMSSLLPDFAGRIKLIYIDPPFATGADFTFNVTLEGEELTKEASAIELKAYRDTWGQGLTSYLQMIYDRLVLMRELLAESGSIFVHLDYRMVDYVKVIMDEIFGSDNFRNAIVVKRGRKNVQAQFEVIHSLASGHDTVLFYSKSPETRYKKLEIQRSEIRGGTWNNHWRGTDRPTMRYPLFGITPNTGQWRWSQERTMKAVKNYETYEREFSKKMTIDEYYFKVFNETDEKLDFVRLSRSGKPEHYVPPSKATLASDVWLDVSAYPSDKDYPTQKHTELLERIVGNFSSENDLVADFFAGSGTTLVAAEKLRRKWIGSDLAKFAIHLARKRLLEIPGCRPFQLLNLGRYFKQKLIENGNSGKKYIDFILQLYKASPLQGFAYIHGKKGNRLVHIGGVDSFVTEREIREAAREGLNVNAKGIDILGWDFEMGLHDLVANIEREYAIDIHLTQIPLEVLEMKVHERSRLDDVKFFDLNYLDVTHEVKGREVKVYIKRFVIANPEYIPEEIRNSIKNFSSFIDYWAVDFDFKGDTFHNMRQEYRTKKNPNLRTQIKYEYDKPGEYDVLVKVVDILGNDTNKLLHIRVE